MINVIKYDDLGTMNLGWLDARYHFSFARYHNPERMGFGNLRVVNDDIVKAGTGFDTHPHEDMEIITYVRSGAITHRDNMGNVGTTHAGNVQVMSAGTGVQHSEHNESEEDMNMYQIWILPREKGVEPRWDMREFPKRAANDHLPLLVSGDKDDADKGALFIHADARIYGGKMEKDQGFTHKIGNQAYILISEGEIELGETLLSKGDAAEITDLSEISLKSVKKSELLVIEV